MTQENEPSNIADTYKQITEAELQASKLEQMLDKLDKKMDSILKDVEYIKHPHNEEEETKL